MFSIIYIQVLFDLARIVRKTKNRHFLVESEYYIYLYLAADNRLRYTYLSPAFNA